MASSRPGRLIHSFVTGGSSIPLPSIGGAVLAGGSSNRMGRDKAFLVREGSTLVERASAAIAGGGAAPVVVVGGDAARVEQLGLVHVPDRYPGAGPLGGIITALDHLATDVVIVLACDHVAPNSAAVRALVAGLGTADVAVPMANGREQWLHSAWRRAVLPTLEAEYQRGRRAPRQIVDQLTVSWLRGGNPDWYRDADRPEDLPDDAH